MKSDKKWILILIGIVVILAIILLPDKIFNHKFKDYQEVDQIVNPYNEDYSLSIYSLKVDEVYFYGDDSTALKQEDNNKRSFVLQRAGFFKSFNYTNLSINIKEGTNIEYGWANAKEGYIILYGTENKGFVFSVDNGLNITREDKKAIALKQERQYNDAKNNHYPELVAPKDTKVSQDMYKIEGNDVYISYDKGNNFIKLPETMTSLVSVGNDHTYYNTLQEGSYIISKEKTAFIFGGTNDSKPTVLYSDDAGNSWNKVVLPTPISESTNELTKLLVRVHYISFPTPKCGYVILGGGETIGQEYNVVYKTIDGGKTWTIQQAFPTDDIIEYGTFVSENIGLLFTRNADGSVHSLFRTEDGGQTYSEIATPSVEGYFLVPLCYEEFKNENGILSVYAYLQANDSATSLKGTFTSKDGGSSW